MRTDIEFTPSFAMLSVELDPGESIKAEAGAMIAQQGVEMKTGMGGRGLFGGISRMISGESFAVNTFTAERSGGWVNLAPSAPGDIFTFRPAARQESFHSERLFPGMHRQCADRHQVPGLQRLL